MPAGGVGSSERIADAAQRELGEESGYRAGRLEPVSDQESLRAHECSLGLRPSLNRRPQGACAQLRCPVPVALGLPPWPARGRSGTRPASPDRRAGRGVQGSPRARAQRRRRPHPAGRLDVAELFARGGGSSVTANCPCADQGGRRARMVVGADYPDRAGLGGVRDAGPFPPLMPPRHRPGHGWRSCSARPTAWRRGRWVVAELAPAAGGQETAPRPCWSGAAGRSGTGPCGELQPSSPTPARPPPRRSCAGPISPPPVPMRRGHDGVELAVGRPRRAASSDRSGRATRCSWR